jgi:ribosomal-protein-alanine N-acetyltransferase
VQLVGPSLTLRYLTPADAPTLLELGSDPEVTRFFSWGPYTRIAEPLAYIAALTRQRAEGAQLDLLVVHHEDGPIGITGISELSRRDRRAVVGTWLGRRWWGSGANAESKALIGHLAFELLGIERLGAYADLGNERSQAALARLGFEREGVLRAWHRHGPTVHDVVLFSLLHSAWTTSPLAEVPVELRGEPPAEFVVA